MSTHERHLCDSCLQLEYEAYAHDRVHESMDQNKACLRNTKLMPVRDGIIRWKMQP